VVRERASPSPERYAREGERFAGSVEIVVRSKKKKKEKLGKRKLREIKKKGMKVKLTSEVNSRVAEKESSIVVWYYALYFVSLNPCCLHSPI
jgi:hypothetical protein